MNALDLSIVIPVCDERENLPPLIDEIERTLDAFGRTYEVIAVDDGSTDGSADLLREMCATHSRLRLICFRRNHGQAAAFDAGFRHASGDVIVTLDADGQNDPADIPRLLNCLDSQQLDFVSGRRAERCDGALLRRAPSKVANWLIRAVTRTSVSDLGCSLKVYRAEVLRDVRLYGEMHRFLAVLIEGNGARVGQLDVNHRPRTRGASKYGLGRTFKVLLDLLNVWFMRGFHTSPIYVFGGASILQLFTAGILAAYVLYDKFAHGVFVHRNPLFILSMVMSLMAVQFLGMGLMAEVMVRTYFESRDKPAYNIASTAGFSAKSERRSDCDADVRPSTRLQVTMHNVSPRPRVAAAAAVEGA